MSRHIRDRTEYETGSKWFADWHRSQDDDDAAMIDLDGVGYCRRCFQALYLVEATRSRAKKYAAVTERLGARNVCPRCDYQFGGIEVFVFYRDDTNHPGEILVDWRSAPGTERVWKTEEQAWRVLRSIRNAHICPMIDRQA